MTSPCWSTSATTPTVSTRINLRPRNAPAPRARRDSSTSRPPRAIGSPPRGVGRIEDLDRPVRVDPPLAGTGDVSLVRSSVQHTHADGRIEIAIVRVLADVAVQLLGQEHLADVREVLCTGAVEQLCLRGAHQS